MLGLRLPFGVPSIEDLAVPAVSTIIFFLAYTSQYLFFYIEPGPLSQREAVLFNVLALAVWVCYDRACTVDPGRDGWVRRVDLIVDDEDGDEGREDDGEDGELARLKKGMRWCKRCEAVKPPRAHHCRTCGRYVGHSGFKFGAPTDAVQVHPQNGSSLPMDFELRLGDHIPALHKICLLRRSRHVGSHV